MAVTLEKMMLDKTAVKMKRFNINEIKQLFKFLHLDLEWKDIVKLVSDCRLRLSVPNIVSVVYQYLKDSSDSIEEIYHRVLLVDAIYHQNSLWWTVSVDKVNKHCLEKEIIRDNIQAMLDKLNINATTYVMKCNKLFWVLINTSKKKNTSPKLNVPIFFTIVPGKVFYVFHRPQKVDSRLLKTVIKSIGAKKYEPYELSGKHLQSMVNLLKNKNKENNQNNALELSNNNKEVDVQEYAQQLFGKRWQVLNQFTINFSMLSNSNPPGKTCKTRVELSGSNIIDGVKDMMLSGILQPPYFSWVTKLPVLGKNCVHIDALDTVKM